MENYTLQSQAAERVVLGALLLNSDIYFKINDLLKPDNFYYERNRIIYQNISELMNIRGKCDMIILTNYLRQKNLLEAVGGAAYITDLSDGVCSTENIEYHSLIIIEKYRQRKYLELSQLLKDRATTEEDVFDTEDIISRFLAEINDGLTSHETVNATTILPDIITSVNSISGGNKVLGFDTGYQAINEVTGGWQDTDLIVIAARPGIGKTSFVLNMIANTTTNKGKLIYSLEMSREQLVKRLIAIKKEIALSKLMRYGLNSREMELFNEALTDIERIKVFINDKGGININKLCLDIKRHVAVNNIGIVFIDYLQLITTEKQQSRDREIGVITGKLKETAKDCKVPIIALSQMHRGIETRALKKPTLSDLRESGNIEQDADIVMFLYNGIEADEDDGFFIPEKTSGDDERSVVWEIAKHRNGALASGTFKFIGKYVKFI